MSFRGIVCADVMTSGELLHACILVLSFVLVCCCLFSGSVAVRAMEVT